MTAKMMKKATDKAYKRATAGYELFGKKLETFTSQRQAAASSMGLRFGLVDESDIFNVTAETVKTGKMNLQFYNQMFSDVVFVMWLCNVPDSRVLRVLRKVDEAKQEAFKWADEKGISITSAAYFMAAGVFFQIMKDITVSTVVPDIDVPDDDETDPNE